VARKHSRLSPFSIKTNLYSPINPGPGCQCNRYYPHRPQPSRQWCERRFHKRWYPDKNCQQPTSCIELGVEMSIILKPSNPSACSSPHHFGWSPLLYISFYDRLKNAVYRTNFCSFFDHDIFFILRGQAVASFPIGNTTLRKFLSFYAWWDIRFLGLILLSAIFNYTLGKYLNPGKTKTLRKKGKILFYNRFNR